MKKERAGIGRAHNRARGPVFSDFGFLVRVAVVSAGRAGASALHSAALEPGCATSGGGEQSVLLPRARTAVAQRCAPAVLHQSAGQG